MPDSPNILPPINYLLPFNKYSANVYSQNGEDGILRKILDTLKIDNAGRWCVEFGAWDGKHFSNTRALVESGWKAIYIEGDPEKFKDLVVAAFEQPNIIAIEAFVSADKTDPNALHNLLDQTPLPEDFEVLSIDIDSNDLDVWDNFKGYFPKIVITEINSGVPPGIHWRHGPGTPGNTFSATTAVAQAKGYTLVCHTGNLIFVRDDLVDRLGINEKYLKYPELLFLYHSEWMLDANFRSEPLDD